MTKKFALYLAVFLVALFVYSPKSYAYFNIFGLRIPSSFKEVKMIFLRQPLDRETVDQVKEEKYYSGSLKEKIQTMIPKKETSIGKLR